MGTCTKKPYVYYDYMENIVAVSLGNFVQQLTEYFNMFIQSDIITDLTLTV